MINTDEWNLFLKGLAFADTSKMPPVPEGLHCTEENWFMLNVLSKSRENLELLLKHVTENPKQWNKWLEKEIPSEHPLPGEWSKMASPF